jgi:acyl carrier protein
MRRLLDEIDQHSSFVLEEDSMLSTKDRAETCKDQIRAFLASNFYIADADALESDTSLLDQGIVDSTGVLEVIGFIEETFGITVEDSELLPENLDSIQGIAQYVLRKQN